MALLHYLKPVDSLPDPRGSLSRTVPSREIAEANLLVLSVQQGAAYGRKRGKYNKYSDADRAAIAKYACQHGAAAAVRLFF